MSVRDSIDSFGDRLQTLLGGLTPRDRALLAFMVILVLGAMGWAAQGSMVKQQARLKAQLNAATVAQYQVDQLLQQYNAAVGKADALDARLAAGKDFTPLTWLESLGNELGLAANIKSITERGIEVTDYYRAQKIDINVHDISLGQAVQFMHKLEEAAQAIWVTEATLNTDRKDRNVMRLRLQISVLQPLDEA
jgi:type II secretory pathway component PulM